MVTLLYLNRNIVTSKGVFEYQINILQELKRRMQRNINYYDTNELVKSCFEFLGKIIDKWYSNDV